MSDPSPDNSSERSLWARALAQPAGANYWRELQGEQLPELGRRELVQLMGASVVMAGLAGCTESPRDRILPHAKSPPTVAPGVPVYYATSLVLDGFATGLLARSNDGRPTKIEGNPEHPASLGATRAFDQASVLDLYSPARLGSARSRLGLHGGSQALSAAVRRARQGQPPWFVLYPQSSPTLLEWCDRVREHLPGARFSFYSPLSRAAIYASSNALFGSALETQYDFGRAGVVVDLASDFLSSMPMSLRWARDFALGRRATEPGQVMNRLYTVEAMPSPTGSLADHRLALRPSDLPRLTLCLLGEVLAQRAVPSLAPYSGGLPRADASPAPAWVRAVAADLLAQPGASAIVVGERESSDCQLLAQLLNVVLGNLGRTITFTPSPLIQERSGESLADLVAAIRARQVGSVVILGPNPVYTAPPELELARWLKLASDTVHLTYFENETSAVCQSVLPMSHYLESWEDARAYDGTLSFVQPLIEPLQPSRGVVEVLAAFAGQPERSGHDLLRESWRARAGKDFEQQRDALLRLGFQPGSSFSPASVTPSWNALEGVVSRTLGSAANPRLELNLQPSPALYDGRFRDNAWLYELPHPVTKQTWGNAAIVGPRTAHAHGIRTSRSIRVEVGGRSLELPAVVEPGHAEGVITIELGYGQAGAALAVRAGHDAYPLSRWESRPLEASLTRLGEVEPLAVTQSYFHPGSRPLGLSSSLEHYRQEPDFTEPERKRQLSLLPEDRYRGTQWGMTIDTTICTGCSACVVACQAENNVPVVGRAGVERGREMHWLRIDRYQRSRGSGQPEIVNQPMLCQHCEKAPCEYVCPVNATVHSPDGLNEMVYNRCIGTRFCSNNCPYKVRRFNWFKYTDVERSRRMVYNPAVTVRERGVMEKCTFCVQRLRAAEVKARVQQRAIAQGEVSTACQQACPTGAIQFDSLEHAPAPVVTWRRLPRRYEALHELGTQPRVQYLARIVNRNPALEEPA